MKRLFKKKVVAKAATTPQPQLYSHLTIPQLEAFGAKTEEEMRRWLSPDGPMPVDIMAFNVKILRARMDRIANAIRLRGLENNSEKSCNNQDSGVSL